MLPAEVWGSITILSQGIGRGEFALLGCEPGSMADRVTDKSLRCSSCGDAFVFTSGEQELFRLRGITREPEQCPTCVRARGLPVTTR
jgi:putative zinc ribbon protein